MNKLLLVSAVLCGGASVARGADGARLTINANQSGPKISPLLYGIFYEEINRAGDGGLYAEMLENRSFEDAGTPVSWNTNGKAVLSLDTTKPLNPQNHTALKVVAGVGGGAIQSGFKGAGLFVQSGQSYNATFYARGAQGPLEVHLEDQSGGVLAKAVVNAAGDGAWKKYSIKLVPSSNTLTGEVSGTKR